MLQRWRPLFLQKREREEKNLLFFFFGKWIPFRKKREREEATGAELGDAQREQSWFQSLWEEKDARPSTLSGGVTEKQTSVVWLFISMTPTKRRKRSNRVPSTG